MARIKKEYPWVPLKQEDLDGKFDMVRIFGRTGPFHIEIGSGRGTFLLNQAQAHPGDNFLGIEWASRYYRYTVDKIGRWDISNVRLIRTEAASFIADFIPDNSVDCFHIYFPDPWPKKSHRKRRFICNSNLTNMIRCLKESGQIRVATDHEEYFEQMKSVFALSQDKLEEIDFLPTAGAETGEWVGTNFERKYLKEQRSIYTIALKKKSTIDF
ncbi:MAG: tRNA (guanosine(46)-N7)-methyltransferase TrmB [Sedimentisphaerales bacterium]|nr:tRNA (guanosine(46)-N7)-methyltransferase TrmB [Sedimentisphaerales bacterium]